VEVLKTSCVIVPVTFRSIIDPPGDCPVNRFINPDNPLITCHVTRMHDNILGWKTTYVYQEKLLSKFLHPNCEVLLKNVE
jgi:hypothetical protein